MLINKLTSICGDHSSLAPLFAKDVVNSAGMTAFSYDAGGKIEAKDKGIDEFGTQAIWMGGLPISKWAFDKTAYKLAKLNPDVDVRLLNDKNQLEVAQKYAQSLKNKEFAQSLAEVVNNSKKAKGLFIGKFLTATALTLSAFFTLVKVKQNYTKKQIEKQFWAKKSEQHFYNNNVAQSPAFKAFMNTAQTKKQDGNKNVSFKGLLSTLKGTMFDPVQNLFIVDIGITGERLANSRTKNEFVETAIKEGSLLFFLYKAGKYVQKGIENFAEKVLKKPIDMHAEVLSSSYMEDAIKSGKAKADADIVSKLVENAQASNNTKALYEFIYDTKNADNTVIKAAKQSGVIKTILKGTWWQKLIGKAVDTNMINPHQYIKSQDIADLAANIKKLYTMAPKDEQALSKFMKSLTKIKIGSVATNMGISCLFLGLIVPYTMMKYREKQQNGSKEFHVQSEIEKQLEQSFKGRIA